MGNFWSSKSSTDESWLYGFFFALWHIEEKRILFLGLDAAGKTTILYKLKLEDEVTMTIPTIGFNVEEIEMSPHLRFVVWDVGGQDKLRSLWRHYYENCNGLVFVVDSADSARFPIVYKELEALNNEPQLQNVPFLIICNKQDLPEALRSTEISRQLKLVELFGKTRKYYLQEMVGTKAKRSDFNWLQDVLLSQNRM